MESTHMVKKYFTLLRLNEGGLSSSLPFVLYVLVVAVTLTGACEGLIKETDTDKFSMAISSFMVQVTIISCNIRLSLNPKQWMELVRLIEEDFFVTRDDFPDREEYWEKIYEIKRSTLKNMKFTYKSLRMVMVVACGLFFCKNAMTYFLNISIYQSDGRSKPLVTPFLVHRPSEFDPVIFLLYVYTLQGLLVIMDYAEGYLIVLLECLSTERLLGDFKIFYQLVHLFCQDYPDDNGELDDSKMNGSRLRSDMNRIVQLHQRITRNYKTFSNNSGYLITTYIATIMIISCINTYFILKSKEIKTAAIFAITSVLLNLVLFLIYKNGQRVYNQNELLRKSLAELPWTDKPRWLRQTVHIMLTQSNVDIELKPFGIYTLNYMSFKDLMKFTFSVGNVLYQKNMLDG